MGRSTLIVCALLAALAGCDGKIPESESAKKVGSIPKQTIDSAASRTTDALKLGEDNNRAAVEKAEKGN